MSNDDILFEQRGCVGLVTLNRPKALNAVSKHMVEALDEKLDEWAVDDSISNVIIRAVSGRAFSAGGDIRHLYDQGMAGHFDFEFFAREYALNVKIKRYPKPYIALIDGIAMGGGVGVSFHARHRMVTENAVFAMPEVGIGFFPDIGGSYLLSRMEGHAGLYLGLTGDRLKAAPIVATNLASHYIRSDDLDTIVDQLANETSFDSVSNDFSVPIEKTRFGEDTDEKISVHFSMNSVSEIMASLQGDESEWAQKTLQALKAKSPTSLEIAFRQIRRGAALSFEDCMRMEYRILRRILTGHDFYEGIDAAIIDKGKTPRWSPPTLQEVDEAAIEEHFKPLGDDELKLP